MKNTPSEIKAGATGEIEKKKEECRVPHKKLSIKFKTAHQRSRPILNYASTNDNDLLYSLYDLRVKTYLHLGNSKLPYHIQPLSQNFALKSISVDLFNDSSSNNEKVSLEA